MRVLLEGLTEEQRVKICLACLSKLKSYLLQTTRKHPKEVLELSSRGCVGPVPGPLPLRKSLSTGNRTWTSGSVASIFASVSS
jgi:hypothetical protein